LKDEIEVVCMWILLGDRIKMESYRMNKQENTNRWIVELEHSNTRKKINGRKEDKLTDKKL